MFSSSLELFFLNGMHPVVDIYLEYVYSGSHTTMLEWDQDRYIASSLVFILDNATCFGLYVRPSSGIQKC
jgi:hypothetical protein